MIARVRGEGTVRVLGDEALAHVDQHRVRGAEIKGLLADPFERGLRALAGDEIALTEVEGHRDDFVTRDDVLLEEHGRVESARVCQDDVHERILLFLWG